MNKIKTVLAAVIIFLTVSFAIAADPVLPQPVDEYINDFAGVLTATDKASISAQLRQVSQKAGARVAVVTVNSVEEYAPGYDPETFAVLLFNAWKLEEKTGRAMLVFVSIQDRVVSMELGSAQSGFYDTLMQKVVKARMVPNFKEGDYGRGISDGVRMLAKIINNQTDLADYVTRFMPAIIAVAAVILLIVVLLFIPKNGKKASKKSSGIIEVQKKEKKPKEKKQEKQKKESQDIFGGGASGGW